MTYQTNSNALVAFKKQIDKDTPATGAGGTVLRQAGGQGLQLTKATVASKEIRRDGMMSRGRHGSQRTNFSYDHELTRDGILEIVEAIVRDTWDADPIVLDESDFTSLTTEANAIVFTSGDPRALGVAAGDVVRLGNFASAGNNNRNLRVALVDATKVHTVEALTVNAVADTDCELTILPKLVQFKGGALLKRYYTIEEVDLDLDKSEAAHGCVWSSIKFNAAADGNVDVTVGGAGTGQFSTFEDGSCPSLTSPTETTSSAFAVVDASFQVNGTDVVDLESWDLTLDIGSAAPATFGSGAQKYAPDVFTGNAQVSLNFTALRKDLQFIQDLVDETQYSFSALLVDNTSEPKKFFNIYIGNATLGAVTKSALSNQAGGRTVSVQVPAALIGKDVRGAGYDACMVKFQTSEG